MILPEEQPLVADEPHRTSYFHLPFPILSGFGFNPEVAPLLNNNNNNTPPPPPPPPPTLPPVPSSDKHYRVWGLYALLIVAALTVVLILALLSAKVIPPLHAPATRTNADGNKNGTLADDPPSGGLRDYVQSTTISPVDVFLGYHSQPSPQLSTQGLHPCSIPAQFTVNQTGVFIPQGWGNYWTAATQRTTGPAEIAIIGDAVPWQGALDSALMLRLGGVLGTGRIPLGRSNCAVAGGPSGSTSLHGFQSVSWTSGGPGGTTYYLGQEGSVQCSGLMGSMLLVEYLSGPSMIGFNVLVNGVQVTSLPSFVSTASVNMYTYTSSSDIHTVTLACPVASSSSNAMCGGYGIKTWYPRQGVIVNNYASLYNSFSNMDKSNSYFVNTPTINQWLGTTGSSTAASFVQGDLVIAWFQSGESQAGCVSGTTHLQNVQAVVSQMASTSVARDVLWFYGVFDGVYWTNQRAALKQQVRSQQPHPFPVLPFAYLDVNMWYDNSPKLFDMMSGFTPCDSMHLASQTEYCWDLALPTLTNLSDVGAGRYADLIMPLLNGTGYYSNSGTWPRQQPGTTWPVPIPDAYLNRPPIPYGSAPANGTLSRMKKGVGVLPEGYHPILYTCDQIVYAVGTQGWYFNWDTAEECHRQMLLLYQLGVVDPNDFPRYIPEWYDELSGYFGNQLLDIANCPPDVCPIMFVGNEPNLWQEGLLPPVRAAQLWPLFESLGRNIARPVPAQSGGIGCPASDALWGSEQWVQEWQRQCMIMLGRPCQYDFGNIHGYYSDVVTTINAVEYDWSLIDGNRPMFLQEFGLPPWSSFWSSAKVSTTQAIEKAPHIYGYSWYALRTLGCNTVDQNGNSVFAVWCASSLYPALDQNDVIVYFVGSGDASQLSQQASTLQPTSVGQLYAAIASSPPSNANDVAASFVVLADPTNDRSLVNYYPLAGSVIDATGNSVAQLSGSSIGFTSMTLPDGTNGQALCIGTRAPDTGVVLQSGGAVTSLSNSYTQCTWMYISPSFSPGEIYVFGTARGEESQPAGWNVVSLVYPLNVMRVYRTYNSIQATLSYNTTLSLGTWHHICVAYDDTRWAFQGTVDGVATNTYFASSQTMWSQVPHDNNMYGGFNISLPDSLQGCLWHVRTYNQPLALASTRKLYTSTT